MAFGQMQALQAEIADPQSEGENSESDNHILSAAIQEYLQYINDNSTDIDNDSSSSSSEVSLNQSATLSLSLSLSLSLFLSLSLPISLPPFLYLSIYILF